MTNRHLARAPLRHSIAIATQCAPTVHAHASRKRQLRRGRRQERLVSLLACCRVQACIAR
jgi:hypothetical protein